MGMYGAPVVHWMDGFQCSAAGKNMLSVSSAANWQILLLEN